MSTLESFASKLAAAARPVLGSSVRVIAYLGLCAAYLQGGLVGGLLLVACLDVHEQPT